MTVQAIDLLRHRVDAFMGSTFRALDLPYTPRFPRGKGAFVRALKHGGDTDQDFARTCATLGLRWVMLVGESKNDSMTVRVSRERYPGLCAELRRMGVAPWLFGWVEPSDVDQFVRDIGSLARECGAVGTVIDTEGPWMRSRGGTDEGVRDLVARLRDATPSVGFTSFPGGPRFFGAKNFPWEALAEACDFGMPQLYGQGGNPIPTESQMRGWQDSWGELLGARVVPVLGGLPAPAELRLTFERTRMPMRAVAWWDLGHVTRSKGRSAEVAALRIGRSLAEGARVA